MNWTDNDLLSLKHDVALKGQYSIEQQKNIRNFCHSQTHVICAYCGCTYEKIYSCIITDGNTIKPCCQLCNIITSFSPKYSSSIIFASSNKTQLEIIRETVNYIYIHKKVPSIKDIDINAEIINIKYNDFFHKRKTTKEIIVPENVKIFFSNQLNITKIITNAVNTTKEFDGFTIDESNDSVDSISIEKNTQKEHKNLIHMSPPTIMERLTKWYTKIYELNKKVEELEKLQYTLLSNK